MPVCAGRWHGNKYKISMQSDGEDINTAAWGFFVCNDMGCGCFLDSMQKSLDKALEFLKPA